MARWWPFRRTRKNEQKAATGAEAEFAVIGGRFEFPSRNDTVLYDEGYKQNAIVARCVNEIARSVSSVPLIPMLGDKDAPENHPVRRLLRRANPMQSFSRLLYDVVAYYSLTGNAYIEAVGEGSPAELWTRRPENMRIKAGRGLVLRYVYEVDGQEVAAWDVDQVDGRSRLLHIKTFNPLDPLRGLSPLEHVAANVDQHNEIDRWNLALLRRGAGKSIIIKTRADLTPEQRKQLRDSIERSHGGSDNAWRVMVLPPGMEVQDGTWSPDQMAITDQKAMTARMICQAFGVPPYLLGLPEGATFSNVQEARLYFWDTTVVPLVQMLSEELSAWMSQWYGDSFMLVPDLDQVTALEQRREMRWDRVLRAQGVLTVNEMREALGYEPIPDGDVVLQPMSIVPFASAPQQQAGGGRSSSQKDVVVEWLEANGMPADKAQELAKVYAGQGKKD